MKIDPAYATYQFKGREVRYRPGTDLDEMRGRLRVRNSPFFTNASPTERQVCYKGHLIVVDEETPAGLRVSVFAFDPVDVRMPCVCNLNDFPDMRDVETAKAKIDELTGSPVA